MKLLFLAMHIVLHLLWLGEKKLYLSLLMNCNILLHIYRMNINERWAVRKQAEETEVGNLQYINQLLINYTNKYVWTKLP